MKRGLPALSFLLIFLVSCGPSLLSDPEGIFSPPLHFTLPSVEKTHLSNGITLYHLEDRELPLASLSILIGTGSAFDPPGKEGLAELTGTILRTGGTSRLKSAEMDDELDFMAAQVSVNVERELTWIGASFLRKDLDRGFYLLSQMLLEPAFETEKLDLAKSLKIEALRRIPDNPSHLAFREFFRILYGDDPRGRLETRTTIENIERPDLIRFYESGYFPGNVRLAVTGDVNEKEAAALADRYFGSWNRPGIPPSLPDPAPHPGGGVYLLKKDIPQSVIVTGQIVTGDRENDYYAFEMLDFILGSGGFRSRIFGRIRNTLGLAYSAGSFYSPRGGYGVFAAYAMTKSDATARVTGEIRTILKQSGLRPVRGEEIAWAKNALTNQFVFSMASASGIARRRMLNDFYGLPEDFLSRYRERIGNVTAEDLERVSRRYLGENRMPMLVLGNGETFDGPLDAFGTVQGISPQY